VLHNDALMTRRYFLLAASLLVAFGLPRAQPQGGWSTDAGYLGTAERAVQLRTVGSVFSAHYAHPDTDTGAPGILLIQPKLTSREITRQRVRGLASAGYAVLAITMEDGETTDTTVLLERPRAGFDWMHAQRRTRDQNIAVVGIGSAAPVAVHLAAREPRLRALVVDRQVIELESAAAQRIAFPKVILAHPFTTSSPLPPQAAGELLSKLAEMIGGPALPEDE